MNIEQAIIDLAESDGWIIEPTHLYDEEGVEGWFWRAPNDAEYFEVGDHQSRAAIPAEVFQLFLDDDRINRLRLRQMHADVAKHSAQWNLKGGQ